MKRSFKERIELLGLSYGKEMFVLIFINILILAACVSGYIFLKEIVIALIGTVVIVVFNFLYLSKYQSMEKALEKEHVDELISLLSYFEMFISNKNNVYTSLRMLIPYCSKFMEDAINTLLFQIDSDKSVQPFIYFANKFSNKIIESLMLSIYQMVDNGENTNQFDEFNNLFATVSREYHFSLIEDKKKSLDTLNSFPLFGAGAITIVLTLCILLVVKDMINGV